jgi:hypothetical protein
MAAFSKSTFNDVEREHAVNAGHVGGLSRSAAKVRAARRNGRKSTKGGRKPTRTLAEMLLRRKLSPTEHRLINKGIVSNELMTIGDARRLLVFFGRPERTQDDAGQWFVDKDWRQQSRDIPPQIQRLILRFRAGARGLFLVS